MDEFHDLHMPPVEKETEVLDEVGVPPVQGVFGLI